MIFNSLLFFLFYAIVIAGYFAIGRWQVQKAFLVLASFIFYGSYRPVYIPILLIPILFDFWVALRMSELSRPAARKALLVSSLALNIGFLAYFKYTNFALESASTAALLFGAETKFGPLDIFLPIGISFHVFQSMAYVIDTYRRQIEPTRSLLDFTLFVSFFPQLVAGPIVRAGEFLPQLERPRPVTVQDFGWATTLITIGVFEKVVLADGILGPIADKVYNPALQQITAQHAWLGTLAFAGQIFFDFNGYSLCAVGSAMALGFHLPWNFRFPYAAIGFSDFWQRWNISLSRWFRDYLYIPLGGNRSGSLATLRNLFLTMAIAGLWHGAAWHFMVWGILHGLFLVAERCAQMVGFWPRQGSAELTKATGILGTFFWVCIAWVFFRATDFGHALLMLRHMFSRSSAGPVLNAIEVYAVIAVMATLLISHALLRERAPQDALVPLDNRVLGVVLGVMLILVMSIGGEARGFIYFQF